MPPQETGDESEPSDVEQCLLNWYHCAKCVRRFRLLCEENTASKADIAGMEEMVGELLSGLMKTMGLAGCGASHLRMPV